ncbi:MAG: hypothetical protein IJ193_09080 [Bacilli bacterium]|nr:hypothetical protein [Bacilli bacterium]
MREFKIRIGKVFIAFSVVLLLLSFSFQLETSKSKTIEIANLNSEKDPNIYVTTVDGSAPEPSKDNSGENKDNKDSKDSKDGKTTKDVQNENPTGSGGNKSSRPSASSEETTPSKSSAETTPTIDSTNATLRSTIENTYGITVKYGSETNGYSVGGYQTVPIRNSAEIYSALTALSTNLSLYPTNFFQEMRSGGLPLTLLLIQKYSSGNITGITERTRNGVTISIAIDFPFEDSFNHETFHYMEHYINLKGGAFVNWNSYNPSDFTYGVFDTKYVYDMTFSENSYFVNSYAQTYEYEDRASTFEFMMANSKISPLNTGKPIWVKARVMCETIDYYFNTVNSGNREYWERYVM